MEHPVFKGHHNEFLVFETLALPVFGALKQSRFSYLRLKKVGVTTFEAISHIARYLKIAPDRIQFAGLKDEDGITEQIISIECQVTQELMDAMSREIDSPGARVELFLIGTGDIAVGPECLLGNSFRMTVRNLSVNSIARFRPSRLLTVYFLNYYDTQRFGMAGQPKMTHLIGKALMNLDYEQAMLLLKQAGTPEAVKAKQFAGGAKEFFDSLDPRLPQFFINSYLSFLWNTKLSELVECSCMDSAYSYAEHNLKFVYTSRHSGALSLLQSQPTLQRFTTCNGKSSVNSQVAPRNTVIQAHIHCIDVAPDELHENTYKAAVSFFLPTGCYATTCIRQIVNMTDL